MDSWHGLIYVLMPLNPFDPSAMISPTSITGSIPITVSTHPEDAMARAVTAVEQMLQRAGASSLSVTGSKIIFTVNLIRFRSNWDILNGCDGGEVEIEVNASGIDVRYRLSTFRWVSIVTALVVAGFIPVATSYSPHWFRLQALLALGWLWLVAGGALIGSLRFRNWLADGIRRKLREDRENWVSAPAPAIVRAAATATFGILLFTGVCIAAYFIVPASPKRPYCQGGGVVLKDDPIWSKVKAPSGWEFCQRRAD